MLVDCISRDISVFLNDNLAYFQSFDKIISYHDYGQADLTNITSIVLVPAFSKLTSGKSSQSNIVYFRLPIYSILWS